MPNTQSPKINLHISIPKKFFDKLKKEGLIDADRIANVETVWFSDTTLERIHITVALDKSEPYTHIATAEIYRNELRVDTKTSPM